MDLNNTNKIVSPLESLEIALNGLTKRNQVISGNIANISTPNYKARTVDFEEALQQVQSGNKQNDIALKVTNEKHFSNTIYNIHDIKPDVEVDESELQVSGNNVDIDREMLELTKTGMRFKAIANITKKHLENTKGIIRS